MSDRILVINAGSSSIKYSVFAQADHTLTLTIDGQIDGIGSSPHFVANDAEGNRLAEHSWPSDAPLGHEPLFEYLMNWLSDEHGDGRIIAAGHRVVHGGDKYSAPVRITEALLTELERFTPLAPLHQPHNLAPIKALSKLYKGLPQVACFDTAFHRTNLPVTQLFGLPRWLTEEGVKRYGFHGLSYEFIARSLPAFDERLAEGRVVVAHLGNGASLCGLHAGRSLVTSMGFTALDGLMMGTRTGNLDPGVVLYLMQEKQLDAKQIEKLLYKQSGLLGVSGISNDMRDLEASEDPRAREAIDLFVHRIVREIGSLSAALGGLDGLVFTAGIGEHSAMVRARVCEQSAWLGLSFDPVANREHGPRISAADSAVSVWVVPTNEERMIALHAQEVLEQLA